MRRPEVYGWLRSERNDDDVPYGFIEKVHIALEYAMAHAHLDEDECDRRRTRTNAWLDDMRRPGGYAEWVRQREEHYAEMLVKPTAEEKEARAKKALERKEAEARAERLLRSVLSAEQIRELDSRDYFHVEVGERRFRLTRSRTNNIKEVDERSRILRIFCVHPVENVPIADVLVAQKLYLEANPEALFKIANVRQVHRPNSRVRDERNIDAQIERDHQQARAQIARLAREGVLRTEQDQQRALAQYAAVQADQAHFVDAALDASAIMQAPLELDPRDLRPIHAAREILNPTPANDERAA